MNVADTAGARLAAWWARALTRTADRGTALDRRAEIESDVHEQLTDACRRGELSAASRSVVARVIRGMPADLVWRAGLELRPGRPAWHLRNPSTAITTLLVVMLPLNWAADTNVAADLAGDRSWPLLEYSVALWVATDVLGLAILLLAVLALAVRIRPRWTAGAERFRPRSRLERIRRHLTATLGVALAGSAVFRFNALEPLGGVFWALFVVSLLLYAALLVATLGVRVLTLGRYLPKVRT